MGKTNNIIEINGKRYDARTGDLLSSAHNHTKPHHQHHQTVTAATTSIPVQHHAERHEPAKPQPAAKHRVHDALRQAAKPSPRHTPQPATTLMRSAVKKPDASLKRHVKAHSSTDALLDRPAARLKPKPSAHRLDSQRLKHAQHIPKSKLVSRFSNGSAVLLAEPPTQVPVVVLPPTVQPELHIATSVKPRSHTKPHPTAAMLERALHNATSHLEPAPPKAKKFHLGLTRKHARA